MILIQGGSTIASIVGLVASLAATWITYESLKSAKEAVDLVSSDDLVSASIGIGLWIAAIGTNGSLLGTGGSLVKAPKKTFS